MTMEHSALRGLAAEWFLLKVQKTIDWHLYGKLHTQFRNVTQIDFVNLMRYI